MKPIQGYRLIKPDDLHWRPSNLTRIPNADNLERTGSENMGARLWQLCGTVRRIRRTCAPLE